jgi:predicted MFS family arabinose efflux permease
MTQTPPQKLWSKDFISISLTSFFLFLTFYTLLVTLPIFVLNDLHESEKSIGLVITTFLVAAVLIRPVTGMLLEIVDQKLLLIISLILFLIGTLAYFWSDQLSTLLIIRFIHGLGFGMATTISGTIAADLIPDHRRGEGMGYFAMFMNLAMVAGPFLGLTITRASTFQALFVMCLVSSILALFLGFILKLPKPSKDPLARRTRTPFRVTSLFERKALPIALVGSFMSFGYSGLLSFISVYAKELDLVRTSSYFFVVFAAAILLSRPFTGKWFDQYGENRIMYPSILIFSIGIFVLSQASTPLLFLTSGALIGLGYGTIVPSFQTLALKAVEPNRRGMATATFFTFFDSGMGLGSFALGIIVTYLGYSHLYFYTSLYILAGVVLYYFLHDRKIKKQEERLYSSIH